MASKSPKIAFAKTNALFSASQYRSKVLWTYVYEKFDESMQAICAKIIYLSF